jgi:cysteine desulfurase
MAAPVVYLDHAASTPLRPEAAEAMIDVLGSDFGNPSGAHRLARTSRRLIDDARDTLAAGLGCSPGEIVFCAGGTEADNLAVFGVAAATGGTVVCSAVEHHAVLHPVEHLGGRIVAVDRLGRLDLEALADALDETVCLVSVMLANNETGVVQPLDEIAELMAELAPHAVLHTDAVQAFPWLDVASMAAPAQLISVAAHKFGGPKGVGALAVRAGTPLEPQILGGGQERGLRSGTHNTPGIVAMCVAAGATVAERPATVERVGALRDRLVDAIRAAVPDVVETGVDTPGQNRVETPGRHRVETPGRHHVETPGAGRVDRSGKVAGSAHLCFPGVESEALLFVLEQSGIMASAASSCASGAQDPSHVLAAMGYDRALAGSSLRLSFGHASTDADVDHALAVVPDAVAHLRAAGS